MYVWEGKVRCVCMYMYVWEVEVYVCMGRCMYVCMYMYGKVR